MPTAPRRAPATGGRHLAGHARPVPRVGLDVPRHRGRGRDDPAVPHGGGPVRASPARSSSPGRSPASGGAFAWPTRREWRDSRDRRRPAARRRHGHGRLRRADDPVGHRRAADRADAGLGRGLRADLPRRAAAAARRRRHRRRVRRRRGPRRAVGARRRGRARPARARGRDPLADLLVAAARCSPRIGRSLPAQPARRDRRPDAHRRPGPPGHERRRRRARPASSSTAVSASLDRRRSST